MVRTYFLVIGNRRALQSCIQRHAAPRTIKQTGGVTSTQVTHTEMSQEPSIMQQSAAFRAHQTNTSSSRCDRRQRRGTNRSDSTGTYGGRGGASCWVCGQEGRRVADNESPHQCHGIKSPQANMG